MILKIFEVDLQDLGDLHDLGDLRDLEDLPRRHTSELLLSKVADASHCLPKQTSGLSEHNVI